MHFLFLLPPRYLGVCPHPPAATRIILLIVPAMEGRLSLPLFVKLASKYEFDIILFVFYVYMTTFEKNIEL